MHARSVLWIALCSSLLPGCSVFTNNEDKPALMETGLTVVTADSEYQRGRQLHLQGKYSEAQQAYLHALSIHPAHPEAMNGMAALIAASGDLNRAIAMLIDLSQSRPESHIYANLGHAYQLKGQSDKARAAYAMALEMDPENQQARMELQALNQETPHQAPVTAQAEHQPAVSASNLPAEARFEAIGPGVYQMQYPVEPALVHTTHAPAAMAVPERSTTAMLPQLKIELVNGNGVTGFARGLRDLLPPQAWRVVRATNYERFNVQVSRIDYAEHQLPAAQRLATELGLQPRFRLNNQQEGTRLRIVLGHDCKDIDSLRARLATLSLQAVS